MEVVVHERVVVLDPALEQQLVRDVRELPPRRHVPGRPPSRHLLHEPDALVEDGHLLLTRHRDRVLVGVPVDADLVAAVDDQLRLCRERLDRVPGDEPGRLELVSREEVEQPRCSDLAGEQPARDVVRGVLAPVRAEPACHRVDVDAVRDEDLLGHHNLRCRCFQSSCCYKTTLVCALCGVISNEHWAEQDGGRRARVFRAALLDRVLGPLRARPARLGGRLRPPRPQGLLGRRHGHRSRLERG